MTTKIAPGYQYKNYLCIEMKKGLIILLMLVYGLSSSGMTISLHYCCGKLDGVSFFTKEHKSCKMGGLLKKTGCCNDKQVSALLNGDQQPETKSFQVSKPSLSAPAYAAAFSISAHYYISKEKLARGAPVPISPIPLFIKHCTFKI